MIIATAYSLYQEELLKRILENDYFEDEYRCIVLIKKGSLFVTNKKIIKIYFEDNKLSQILNNKKIIKYLLKEISKYDIGEVEIIIADIYQYLNNYLYGYAYRKKIELVNYPDGLLNLVNYKINYYQKIKIFIKKFFCKIQGWNYYFYDYPSGIDKYRKIYTYNKKIIESDIISKKNPKIIELISEKIKLKEYKNGLVLGQDNLINKLGLKKYYNYILNQIKELKKDKKIEKIYYKPHPKYLNKDFQTKINEYCLIINDNEIVEKLIEKYQIVKVISFYSTALINLKIQYDGIECIAFEVQNIISITKEADVNKIKKIFNSYGVEMIDSISNKN